MSRWLLPDEPVLREVISASEGELLLCSPYVSTPALSIVSGALTDAVAKIEFWTKLDARDWLTGSSDLEGLLDFIDRVEGQVTQVSVRHARNLHAKIIISDGPKAMAGSANLTAGGFRRNIEVARLVTGAELGEMHRVVNAIRPRLSLITHAQLVGFVSECTGRVDTKEALLELIREETPAIEPNLRSLMPYRDFLSYLRSRQGHLANEILRIATNEDGNNNTGKVKQAFFGVQRFLQEYPQHSSLVEKLPIQWFDVMESDVASDWIQFLERFSDEVNPDYEYSIPTLRGYLPTSQGGTLEGGGGGSNQLKRVWPYVGRAMRSLNVS